MRLMMVATEFPPAKGYGLARYSSELVTALASAGHEVHVVTANFHNGSVSRLHGGVTVHTLGELLPLRHFHWVGDAVLSNVRLLERAVEVAEKEGPFDVLLAHDWLGALAAKSLKGIYKLPLLLFMHDTEPGRRGNKLTREQLYVAEMETWACGHADAVVVNSAFTATDVARFHNVPRRRLRVVPCGVNPSRFEVDCHLPDFRALFAAPDERLVLYAGRLSPEKGIDLLVDAVPVVLGRRPRTRFLIAGDGVLRRPLEARVAELGIADHVHLVGHLSDKPLGAAYRAADLVVVPSRYEPSGMVALEAMACGTPVVVADTGALGEIVPQNPGAVRFAPGDKAALASAICTALTAEVRDGICSELREHAANYTWERAARSVMAVCKHVFESSSRSRTGCEQ